MTEQLVEKIIEKDNNVALLGEDLYKRNKMACPHCLSKATPTIITDCAEMPEELVDIIQCKDCRGISIVLSFPKMYLHKPVFLNWTPVEKGVKEDEQEPKQIEAGADEKTAEAEGTTGAGAAAATSQEESTVNA